MCGDARDRSNQQPWRQYGKPAAKKTKPAELSTKPARFSTKRTRRNSIFTHIYRPKTRGERCGRPSSGFAGLQHPPQRGLKGAFWLASVCSGGLKLLDLPPVSPIIDPLIRTVSSNANPFPHRVQYEWFFFGFRPIKERFRLCCPRASQPVPLLSSFH